MERVAAGGHRRASVPARIEGDGLPPSARGRGGHAEVACRKQESAPDRAQIREAIRGRARDLSAEWRAAWRRSWEEIQQESEE